MKKKKNIVLSIFLSILMLFSALFIGCNKQEDGEKIDNSKVQIFVSNYNGGYGDAWLRALKSSFEKEYEDYVLGDKVGVQIIINNHKSEATELSSLSGSNNEIFFLSGDYYREASRDLFMDITDIAQEKVKGVSLEDRLTQGQKDYFTSYQGKYYALPREEGIYGIVYDVDLFNENSLYFKKNGCQSEKDFTGLITYTNEEGQKSTGPDGVYGTYDDGLPATWEDFFTLLGQMRKRGVVPITWTGWYYQTYLKWLMMSIATDYEGVDNLATYYNLSGTVTSYVESINKNDNNFFDDIVIKEENITTQTGYKLFNTAGRYYALKIIQKLISNDNYYDSVNCFEGTVSHTDAQCNFIDDEENIAMIAEGSWWQNEASSSFDMLGKDVNECRYAMMPMPKVSKNNLGKATYAEQQNSWAFIRRNVSSEKVPLLKAFYKYCYTEEAMQAYTVSTNAALALDYELTTSQYEDLTYFGKSVWNFHNGTNGNIVYQASGNPSYVANYNSFYYTATFDSKIGGTKVQTPFDAYRKKETTALDYFNALVELYKNNWSGYLVD